MDISEIVPHPAARGGLGLGRGKEKQPQREAAGCGSRSRLLPPGDHLQSLFFAVSLPLVCDLVLTTLSSVTQESWLKAAGWLLLLSQEQPRIEQKDTQTDRQTPLPQCSMGYSEGVSPSAG